VMSQTQPWFAWPKLNPTQRRAGVVGAGLAGCYLARELAELGWDVELFEQDSCVGSRASWNPQALLFPIGEAERGDTASRLLLEGYVYSKNIIPRWLNAGVQGSWTGVVTQGDEIYYPQSGWINLSDWCHKLIQHPRIHVHLNHKITQWQRDQGYWMLGDVHVPYLILTTGLGTLAFPGLNHLQLQGVKGQLTWVQSHGVLRNLKHAVCGKGHLLPEFADQHLVGATFERDDHSRRPTRKADQSNLLKLAGLIGEPVDEAKITHHWADVRTTTRDHIPCMGPWIDPSLFLHHYAELAKDKNRCIPPLTKGHEGLFVMTGFGSKGLTTIPWLAHHCALRLNGSPSNLSKEFIQALSPLRFMVRTLIRQAPC
jgi:tRNA 5-methylaminomethyl-2-thiouridine biosynthesis bifunctional protein